RCPSNQTAFPRDNNFNHTELRSSYDWIINRSKVRLECLTAQKLSHRRERRLTEPDRRIRVCSESSLGWRRRVWWHFRYRINLINRMARKRVAECAKNRCGFWKRRFSDRKKPRTIRICLNYGPS